MPSRKVWFFNPDSGGIKIPDSVKSDVDRRINSIAEEHFKGKYIRLDIHFKGQFCYVDAFQEPEVICAGFDILAMINGVLHFTLTAMRNMNCPFSLMVSSLVNQKMHS